MRGRHVKVLKRGEKSELQENRLYGPGRIAVFSRALRDVMSLSHNCAATKNESEKWNSVPYRVAISAWVSVQSVRNALRPRFEDPPRIDISLQLSDQIQDHLPLRRLTSPDEAEGATWPHLVEQGVGVAAADGADLVRLVAGGAEVEVLDDQKHGRAHTQILRDVAEVALGNTNQVG